MEIIKMKCKKSNKGFSLVELIIVIAIMAILIGVMAPQLLKYVDRSRVSADRQLADAVRTAVVTALMDPEVDDAPTTATYNDIAGLYGGPAKFVASVKETLNETDATKVEAKLKSNYFKTAKIKVDILDSKVTVTVESTDDTKQPDIVIE